MQINLGIGVGAPRGGKPGDVVHVFGLIGQSNMQGSDTNTDGRAWPSAVRQYHATSEVLAPPEGNLNHPAGHRATATSLALTFAEDYLAARADVQLVLVPGAVGGSGFSTGGWNRGDAAYQNFVADMNAVFAGNPGFVLKGFLWHQGEADAQAGTAAAEAYRAALDGLIADLRADVTAAGATTPFVTGGLMEGLAGATAVNRDAVHAVLGDVVNRVPFTGFAPSTGLVSTLRDTRDAPDGYGAGADDGVHFDCASLRTLGSRYFAAFAEAEAHATLPAPAELLADGGFDDSSAWTLAGGAAVLNGKGVASGAGSWSQDAPLVAGRTYVVGWVTGNYGAGTLTPRLTGGTEAAGGAQAGAGEFAQLLTAKAGNGAISLETDTPADFRIDAARATPFFTAANAGAPLATARLGVILLHGRAHNMSKVEFLATDIPADCAILYPEAPFDGSWWPADFTTAVPADDPQLHAMLDLVGRNVQALLDAGLTEDRIVLVGHSQGASLALEFAARHTIAFRRVFISHAGALGVVAGDSATRYPSDLSHLAIEISAHDEDPSVPYADVEATDALLRAAGASVSLHTETGAIHTVTDHERIRIAAITAAPVAPGQVLNLSATAGDAQNALAWSAPASDGGSAITDYAVEVSTDGGSSFSLVADGTSTATSYTHAGLQNGTGYTYRVSAINGAGTGPASATASATPVAQAANLLTNGDWASGDFTGWGGSITGNGNASVIAGQLEVIDGGALIQDGLVLAGDTAYRLTVEVVDNSAGQITPYLLDGGSIVASFPPIRFDTPGLPGTFQETVVTTAVGDRLQFSFSGGTDMTVDDIVLEEV